MLHVERQAKHHGLAVAERAGDSASRVLARGCRRVQSFRHGADRPHHVGLFDVEIIFTAPLGTSPASTKSGVRLFAASPIPVKALVSPGPECTLTSVSSPVALA